MIQKGLWLVVIAMATVSKAALALTGSGVDAVITSPGWVSPYGLLWSLVNPYWLGAHLYRLFVLLFDLAFLGFYLRLGISRSYLAVSQTMSMLFYSGFWIQNVTVVAVIPLGAVNPLLLAVPIMMKFPFGWSWDFDDPHVAFFLNGSGWGHFSLQNIVVYAVLGALWAMALAVWVSGRRRAVAG